MKLRLKPTSKNVRGSADHLPRMPFGGIPLTTTKLQDDTVPNIAELIKDHVTLEVDCVDRLYLNAYIPKLQGEKGVIVPSRSVSMATSGPSGRPLAKGLPTLPWTTGFSVARIPRPSSAYATP